MTKDEAFARLPEVTRMGRAIDKREQANKDARARLNALYGELSRAGVPIADIAKARGCEWSTIKAAIKDEARSV